MTPRALLEQLADNLLHAFAQLHVGAVAGESRDQGIVILYIAQYRRDNVGFVFQFYNLVQNLTAKENVELASEIVKDAMDPV